MAGVVPGEAFTASNCNQKLIGARFYNAGFGGNAGIDATLPFEFNSPRDHNGHGTHTATTAGGNANVPATGEAAVFGSISGIAPRARIAAYKACWSVPGTAGSCFRRRPAWRPSTRPWPTASTSSTTRSAVRGPTSVTRSRSRSCSLPMRACSSRRRPATAARRRSTVAHPGPWLTTVAAGTHNRNGEGSVTLGNGATYAGASVATPVTAPLIDSTAAGLPGADPHAGRAVLRRCTTVACGARSGQGGRQDRRLPARRRRRASTRAWRFRRPAAWA